MAILEMIMTAFFKNKHLSDTIILTSWFHDFYIDLQHFIHVFARLLCRQISMGSNEASNVPFTFFYVCIQPAVHPDWKQTTDHKNISNSTIVFLFRSSVLKKNNQFSVEVHTESKKWSFLLESPPNVVP